MLEVIGYVVLGLFLLMVPGFLFSLILYPKPESLDFWSRMGVSLGLGVMLAIYVGYFLAKPELAMLQLAPFVGLTVGVCAVLAIIAYFRGGFEVMITYTRAVMGSFRKFKPPEKPRPPVPPQPERKEEPERPLPEQPQEPPKEQPEERAIEQPQKPQEEGPEKQPQEQHEEQAPGQPSKQGGETG